MGQSNFLCRQCLDGWLENRLAMLPPQEKRDKKSISEMEKKRKTKGGPMLIFIVRGIETEVKEWFLVRLKV